MIKTSPSAKTFTSFSFGCRVNQAERNELDGQFAIYGFSYVEKNPAFYIINSCAVTKKAERGVRQFINQIRKRYPYTKIVVTGCAATKWINEGIKLPNVDLLIDNVNKEYIAYIIKSKLSPQMQDPAEAGQFKEKKIITKQANITDKYLSSKRLLVKIQDGCHRFCTYCIVPYLRGQPKSRKVKEIVNAVKNVPVDLKEVILCAVNTEAFGQDTGEKLTGLVDMIIKKTRVPRISFGSVNPWSIDGKFLKFYKKILTVGRLVNFFHIPLQSGSNKILTIMKRGYKKEEFLEKIKSLEKINPLALLATDVIVGFLEETDRDFGETYKFLRKSPISKFHIFRFSKREKTASFFMAKKLKEPSGSIKKKRAKILRNLSKKKYQKFLSKLIGKSFPALFLDKRIENFQEALLDNQVPIFVKTTKNLAGEIKHVNIERLSKDKLVGKVFL